MENEKKYFYTDGNERFGPFSMDDLRNEPVNRETLVWYDGLSGWQKAGTVFELKELFHLTPPPLNDKAQSKFYYMENDTPQRPKTWLAESILVTLFCCLPFGLVGIINAAKVDTAYSTGNISEAQRLSQQAGKWTKIGFWVGMASILLYVLFVVVLGAGAAMFN